MFSHFPKSVYCKSSQKNIKSKVITVENVIKRFKINTDAELGLSQFS